MYAEIKDAIGQYNLLYVQYQAFVDQLQKQPELGPPAVTWGKHDATSVEFTFFDRQVRLHLDVVKFHGALLGRITIARIQKAGELMDLLRPIFFNATGNAWLEKPETQALVMADNFEPIVSYMFMPLLPSTGRNL